LIVVSLEKRREVLVYVDIMVIETGESTAIELSASNGAVCEVLRSGFESTNHVNSLLKMPCGLATHTTTVNRTSRSLDRPETAFWYLLVELMDHPHSSREADGLTHEDNAKAQQ
jgi:hypothetical protein